MDRTEAVLRRWFAALPAPAYDLGILGERGMYRLEAVPAARILRMLPYLRRRNAHGAHIYGRPTGESPYTLLDDAYAATLNRLTDEGFAPAAVVETSPGNFQAWLRHRQPFPKELGTLAAQMLAERFGTDRNAADWRRFGRLPGFTNRKPQHRDSHGLFPFVLLHGHNGEPFAAADSFHADLLARHAQIERERTALRLSFTNRTGHTHGTLSLPQFRGLPRYAGRPAAADMAFSVAALASGWPEQEIASALSQDYLSRDASPSRRAAYIRRTMAKALRWAG